MTLYLHIIHTLHTIHILHNRFPITPSNMSRSPIKLHTKSTGRSPIWQYTENHLKFEATTYIDNAEKWKQYSTNCYSHNRCLCYGVNDTDKDAQPSTKQQSSVPLTVHDMQQNQKHLPPFNSRFAGICVRVLASVPPLTDGGTYSHLTHRHNYTVSWMGTATSGTNVHGPVSMGQLREMFGRLTTCPELKIDVKFVFLFGENGWHALKPGRCFGDYLTAPFVTSRLAVALIQLLYGGAHRQGPAPWALRAGQDSNVSSFYNVSYFLRLGFNLQ